MSREHCAKRLMNIVSTLKDVDVDVSPLFPLVDNFIICITDTLHSSVKEGESAEKLLEVLAKE